MNAIETLKSHLRPGTVYRRSDLAHWSKAVDRHMRHLVDERVLVKVARGLYCCPSRTVFGEAIARDEELVRAFLQDDHFLIMSSNVYNALGIGTTQLYNETVVYNHKRRGRFELGGRVFTFRVRSAFPKKLTVEFLLVDVVENVDRLAEDADEVLRQVKKKAMTADKNKLVRAVKNYGSARAKKRFAGL